MTNEGLVRNPLTKHVVVQVVTITGKEDNPKVYCIYSQFGFMKSLHRSQIISPTCSFVVVHSVWIDKDLIQNQCQFKRDWQPLNSKKVAADCSWILLTCCRLFQVYIYIRCPVPSLLFLGVVNFLDMKGLPNHEPFFLEANFVRFFRAKNS